MIKTTKPQLLSHLPFLIGYRYAITTSPLKRFMSSTDSDKPLAFLVNVEIKTEALEEFLKVFGPKINSDNVK